MTAPVIGVLALQGDVREHLAALAGAGADARPVRRPAELDAVDGLVVPGGESTTMSKLADIFEMREPIDKRIAGGMPVYGSCAGMIMLAAEVLDGRPDQRGFAGIDMTVRRNAFGRQVDSFEAPVEITGVGGPPFHAVFIRAPWVERVGAGVEVLGRVTEDDSRSQRGVRRAELEPSSGPAADRIVAVRQGHLLATSFHPELTGDLRLHRYFVDLVRAAA
ncbi:pyridoxal 5'-phosphate synthase glutaminase subunit PdxT [Micromonospora halotolerans]|uniref:Pyridoxal 5'-phosphate synthase subunit PdxT n=1 Tax=Micromonospora halotolerans TaxID=709879 RepID=A0ABY9ZXH7_9ACTN|nr:pyridoxal 5'-phosphate synthase glutaminase subunit PdxT [Micromonospora halotolerans]WNM39917.1 pyridoxal 5'-phosphate synthase glutaminase subunit PdxT [Micromonospora halotolerans]